MQYTDELFENERRHDEKWSNQLLITDRDHYSDRAGGAVHRQPKDKSAKSLKLPTGWKWHSEWSVDVKYTNCDRDGWSYGSSFEDIDKKLSEQKSSLMPISGKDTCRRRRWIRDRIRDESSDRKEVEEEQEHLETEASMRSKFGAEVACDVCKSKFHLLRRRHHCRSCLIAVCKDCSAKASKRQHNRGRPQIYCTNCIRSDSIHEVQRRTSNASSLLMSSPMAAPGKEKATVGK